MLIDSHCHPDAPEFRGDERGLVARALAAGIEGLVAIGGPAWVAELEEPRLRAWATVGVHPHDAAGAGEELLAGLEAQAEDARVIGIGEIGLDYHYDHSPRPVQIEVFERQVALAARLCLPLSVHCRDAWEDCLPRLDGVPGVFHCFTGGLAEAQRALNAGWYLSFSGMLTFAKADTLRQVASWAPAERLLVETDAPYLAPTPHRGKRNEPAYLVETVAALGRLRGWSAAEAADRTAENFFVCFHAPPPDNRRYMATKENSFDVVSEIDLQEVANAVQQALKEVGQRYDLKDSRSIIHLDEKERTIALASADEYKLNAVIEVLQQKLIKRGVPLRAMNMGKVEQAAAGSVRQVATLQHGIPAEKGREIVRAIKDAKLKVQASIQGDTVRVSGKDRDTLQEAIALLKRQDFGIDMQFTNYRSI